MNLPGMSLGRASSRLVKSDKANAVQPATVLAGQLNPRVITKNSCYTLMHDYYIQLQGADP